MQSLPIFVRLQNRPVILIGEGEAADAKRLILERAGADIFGEDGEAALAVIALEDEDEAKAAAARLKARNILVNAVDRPGLCDFTLPAIIDRDPVIVAIGTGGASAGMAKAIRQRLEQLLPARLGAIARRLKDKRADIKAKWPDAAARRRAIDAALDEGGVLDPLAPHVPRDVDSWIDGDDGDHHARHDQLEIIQLRSADPHDLTIGETLLLGRADTLYLAPGVPQTISNRARADAQRVSCAELPEEPAPGLSVFVTVTPLD
ncbi:precorrin-2 dehydrogenase/sirohydrochlorin ferrochelatase family protein [Parasphingopyxis lamellibrachiae]|uniref:precorrin-2 dehydrogenase n=1 Tax=Parasphingopyxis lamellibrachiae TaxID=680125 RepID=A0A3D9FHC5_9SPHN|nr:NAD(P)-dependent oxidoreductase [Parasphingopyxis lamellibrachiae]RED17200.1 uroporphyrin-III C-methyltransferase/precorrin-2 dehydrogenase/sirohydrochlorin ferrochelatase [Parasphingopyxis lamellibrachiae]